MMQESELLSHIYCFNRALPDRVTVPPGDDMGAMRLGGEDVLVSVDQVADGVHVDLASTDPARVGRKAMARSLSDVAAMGALPTGALVAVSLPRELGAPSAEALFDAMRETGEKYACPLIGGDIAIWAHPLLVTVTVLARTGGVPPLRREGARVGDVVCVTGTLGGSLHTIDQYTHHLDFQPRLSVGRALAETAAARPHCMIDISDGLACDVAHLCRAGNVSALIDAAKLPISAAAEACSKMDGRAPWEHAVSDGEDYELCFTIDPERVPQAIAQGTAQQLTVSPIGTITPADRRPLVTVRLADGTQKSLEDQGWEHGRKKRRSDGATERRSDGGKIEP